MSSDLAGLEFPRHVHKPSIPGAWVFLVVQTADECARALADGWSLVPILIREDAAPVPPAVETVTSAPAAVVEPPKRRGFRR